jgi:oxaloacetate decarboxylase gamma subunit
MNEILMEGLSLMCIGMGTVLLFLCILIFAMNIMSSVVGYLNTIFPEVVPETAGAKTKKSSSNDEEIAVAIVASMFKK